MAPRTVVSEANILTDFEDGGPVAEVFRLGIVIVVPDVIFYEELEQRHAHLLKHRLIVRELTAQTVEDAVVLAQRYRRPSRNDLMALALARQEKCPLLSGDSHLRLAAEQEQVELRGSLWLGEQLVVSGLVTACGLRSAFEQMRQRGRRLPWKMVNELLVKYGAAALEES
ncbi:DUF3368 domain-containing protein [Myxococcota bacterium]